mgnify:CR=1 FL=1
MVTQLMPDNEDTKRRLEYATQHILNRNVMTMPRSDWESLIREDGKPTQVTSLGSPFQGVMHDAQVVAIAASGYHNTDPGIDIVRHDEKDAPYVHNTDHYTVCQTLTLHSDYDAIANTAGVADSPQLRECLNEYVFVVKRNPGEFSDHWSIELPERIRNAREKGSSNET